MDDCLFCKIVAKQIKANVVYEDPQVLAFRDINPQAPVHVLVIPKVHKERLSVVGESDSQVLIDLHRAIKKIVDKETSLSNGFRVVINNGENGGQTVGHLHYHLLGGRFMTWPPG